MCISLNIIRYSKKHIGYKLSKRNWLEGRKWGSRSTNYENYENQIGNFA